MTERDTTWDYVTNERLYEEPEEGNAGLCVTGGYPMNSGEHAWFEVTPNGFTVFVGDHYELRADCWQLNRDAMKKLAETMLKAYDSHPGTEPILKTESEVAS